MRGIRIARFSELYLFIFQQIQLVMVFLGGGSRGKENPARWPGKILKNRFNKMVFTVQTYAIIVNLSSLH